MSDPHKPKYTVSKKPTEYSLYLPEFNFDAFREANTALALSDVKIDIPQDTRFALRFRKTVEDHHLQANVELPKLSVVYDAERNTLQDLPRVTRVCFSVYACDTDGAVLDDVSAPEVTSPFVETVLSMLAPFLARPIDRPLCPVRLRWRVVPETPRVFSMPRDPRMGTVKLCDRVWIDKQLVVSRDKRDGAYPVIVRPYELLLCDTEADQDPAPIIQHLVHSLELNQFD